MHLCGCFWFFLFWETAVLFCVNNETELGAKFLKRHFIDSEFPVDARREAIKWLQATRQENVRRDLCDRGQRACSKFCIKRHTHVSPQFIKNILIFLPKWNHRSPDSLFVNHLLFFAWFLVVKIGFPYLDLYHLIINQTMVLHFFYVFLSAALM